MYLCQNAQGHLMLLNTYNQNNVLFFSRYSHTNTKLRNFMAIIFFNLHIGLGNLIFLILQRRLWESQEAKYIAQEHRAAIETHIVLNTCQSLVIQGPFLQRKKNDCLFRIRWPKWRKYQFIPCEKKFKKINLFNMKEQKASHRQKICEYYPLVTHVP